MVHIVQFTPGAVLFYLERLVTAAAARRQEDTSATPGKQP